MRPGEHPTPQQERISPAQGLAKLPGYLRPGQLLGYEVPDMEQWGYEEASARIQGSGSGQWPSGYSPSSRGRISQDIKNAFDDAHS